MVSVELHDAHQGSPTLDLEIVKECSLQIMRDLKYKPLLPIKIHLSVPLEVGGDICKRELFESRVITYYRIRVSPQDPVNLVSILAHEIYHAYQFDNNLDNINSTEERKRSYSDRDFEVQARKYQNSLDEVKLISRASNLVVRRLRSKLNRSSNA